MAEGWADLCEAIGTDAALRLAIALAGRRTHIPHSTRSARTLTPHIGTDKVAALVAAMPGAYITLPVGFARHAAVQRLRHHDRLSISDIAHRLLISRSTVKELLRRPLPEGLKDGTARPAENDRQMDLLEWPTAGRGDQTA